MSQDVSSDSVPSRSDIVVHPDLAVEKTSTIFMRIVRENDGDAVEVRSIVNGLRDRGFGMLMTMFAVPNAVIPGISGILGAPILLFALQIAYGRRTPWLPEFMLRQKMNKDLFQNVASRVTKFLIWIEKRLKPRWLFMSTRLAERLLGCFLAVVAVALMMPIPWGNALPAFGIAFMSIGLIEKDGIAIIIGIILGILGIAFVLVFGSAVLYGALEALKYFGWWQ